MWDFLFPGRYPPPLDVIITHEKKLERKEVMAEIQPLLLRLRGKWTEELNADIEATLTPEKHCSRLGSINKKIKSTPSG